MFSIAAYAERPFGDYNFDCRVDEKKAIVLQVEGGVDPSGGLQNSIL